MANISDAAGTVLFKANNKETIKELFTLTKLLEIGGDYSTYLSEWDEVSSHIYEIDDDYKYELEENFCASGRWSYYCNIEYMFSWIMSAIERRDDIKKDRYLNMLESIVNADWMIDFDYVDYEPGCDLFGRYHFYYVHKRGDDLESLVPYEGDCEDYELSIVNYAKYLDRSIEEALDEWSFKYDDPEELKEVIEKERECIENFIGKPFEELIKDSYVLESLYKDAQ